MAHPSTPNTGADGLPMVQRWINMSADNNSRVRHLNHAGWRIKLPREYYGRELILMEIERSAFEKMRPEPVTGPIFP